MTLRDRLRPWHALLLATFIVGAAVSLSRADAVTSGSAFVAVLAGLLAVVILQFTVGNVWGYAVEYANAGGSWTDAPFLAPFVVAGFVGVAVVLVNPGGLSWPVFGAALWSAFWGFVVAAAVVALLVRFYTGYAEGRS